MLTGPEMHMIEYVAESPPQEHGGFPTVAIEAAKLALKQIRELTAQRDELLKACKALLMMMAERCSTKTGRSEWQAA